MADAQINGQAKDDSSPSHSDKKPQGKTQEKLRDSTLEKLLNGDYGEIDATASNGKSIEQ